VLKLELSGGGVMIRWGWQRYSQFLDTCELQVDRGAGAGWQVLAFDTTPNYLDTQPLPAPAARWKYRAIYRIGDQRAGQWSNEVSLPVGA